MSGHRFGNPDGKTRVQIQPGLHALIPDEPTPPIREHQDSYGREEKRMTHTPGPWTLHVGSGREAYIEAMEGDVLIAECHDGEAEANARLIAAAPELLEALLEIEATVSLTFPQRKKIQTAITKAL